jgi:hypothetical protein
MILRVLPRIELFRSLFPSWRFFDRPGEPYLLEVCWDPMTSGATPSWEQLYGAKPFRWWNLFLNPHGNFVMAWQSLVERLAQELEDFEESDESFPAGSVAYALVLNGVEEAAHGRSFQFRIRCGDEVLLLSPPSVESMTPRRMGSP